MSELILPGNKLIYMKIGVHANESLDSIIARKIKEIDETGISMWGYGGTTCHPSKMIQPAFKDNSPDVPIYLAMEEVVSNHKNETDRATDYSLDNKEWLPIMTGVNVIGSKYALVLDKLEKCDFSIALDKTSVAHGPSAGKNGADYVRGQVDKACLIMNEQRVISNVRGPIDKKISLIGRLKAPYSVFLKYD